MKKGKLIKLLSITIISTIFLAACASNNQAAGSEKGNVQNDGAGQMGAAPQSHAAVPNEEIAPISGNTIKIGEQIIITKVEPILDKQEFDRIKRDPRETYEEYIKTADGVSEIKYTIKAVNYYHDLKNFNLKDFDNYPTNKYVSKDGVMNQDVVLAILDITAECIQESKWYNHITFNIYSEKDMESTNEVSYFKITDNSATKGQGSKSYNQFKLPKGKTSAMQVGFFVLKGELASGDIVVRVGSKPEKQKYFPLKK